MAGNVIGAGVGEWVAQECVVVVDRSMEGVVVVIGILVLVRVVENAVVDRLLDLE
jgi:hypothetical protein